MKKPSWEFEFGIALISASAILYFIHFIIFDNPNHIFLWGMTNLAFLPISVLLVTLVIDRLLEKRQRGIRVNKVKTIIGLFFSEIGNDLLVRLSDLDPHITEIKKDLIINEEWNNKSFNTLAHKLKSYEYHIIPEKVDLKYIKKTLNEKRDFLLRLMENPSLLEDESFSRVLRAVFHLTEELNQRKIIEKLSRDDRMHLVSDVERVYGRLVSEWMSHMKYLRNNHNYLFSLAMRTNPFDETANPTDT